MNDQTKEAVRKAYGEIAIDSRRTLEWTGPATEVCGHDEGELALLPGGAVLGLGCGNPLGIADAKQGEVVLDLGSGAGIDGFLAASQVGASGRVIGVDMTFEMIERATRNAQFGGYVNVEFRFGDIAHLPVPDASTDLVISNCVIDLVLDQSAVFSEAYRVLRPRGRVVIADIVGGGVSAVAIGPGARDALRVPLRPLRQQGRILGEHSSRRLSGCHGDK